jgi:hypothetical protein
MKNHALIFLLSGAAFGSAPAAILASYDFETAGGPLANKTPTPGVTASAITFGAKADTGDSFSSNTSPTGGAQSLTIAGAGLGNSSASTSVAVAEAITDGNFLTFTLTPGSAFSLTSITFDKGRLTGNSNDLRILVTSSLDDSYNGRMPLTNSGASLTNVLESNQTSEISAITAGAGQSWGTNSNVSVDLSAPMFQNLVAPITFRIYAFNLGTDAGNNANQLFFDNIVVNGTVIPEPSAALLGFTAILGTALRRRRR